MPLIRRVLEVLDSEDVTPSVKWRKKGGTVFKSQRDRWNEYKVKSLVSLSKHHSVPHKSELLLCVS